MADTEALQQGAVRRDEGPHQGGRFLGADEGRAVCLRHVLRHRRRAAALFPHAARRRAGGRSSSTATPRPTARPISASPASTIRRDHRRLLWGYRRQGLGILHAARPRSRDRRRTSTTASPDTGGGGVWAPTRQGFFYTGLDENHRPSKTFFHILGTTAARGPAGLRGDGSGLLHGRRRLAARRLHLHRHPRPRNVGILAARRPTTRRPSRSWSRRARPGCEYDWPRAATSSTS